MSIISAAFRAETMVPLMAPLTVTTIISETPASLACLWETRKSLGVTCEVLG